MDHKYIVTFYISMDYSMLMQRFEPVQQLLQEIDRLIFSQLPIATDIRLKISIFAIFHHNVMACF